MIDLAELTLERVVERIGSTYYGKYRGLVSDVSDPENRCRIKATCPACSTASNAAGPCLCCPSRATATAW
jgi:hypothetical protein